MPKKICVYCSSSDHVDPAYFAVARAVGEAIGRRGDTLVYGGGKGGLMGECARAVHASGGRVVGVIPESMTDVEIAYHQADELIVTQTMRERKQIMEDRSDVFVTLPGGFGTLEELSEIMVGRILCFHNKPIYLVNPDGFYDPLIELFNHFVEHQFAKPKHLAMVTFVDTAEELFAALHPEDATASH